MDDMRRAEPARGSVRSAPARRRIEFGMLDGQAIEQAFMIMIYVVMCLLVVLSVFGTFYGILERPARLIPPWLMVVDAVAQPWHMAGALVAQAGLTLTQYGAHQLVRRSRHWWWLYMVALAISVYYNIHAYLEPLSALGVPWLVASVIIVVGDVLPELVAVRR